MCVKGESSSEILRAQQTDDIYSMRCFQQKLALSPLTTAELRGKTSLLHTQLISVVHRPYIGGVFTQFAKLMNSFLGLCLAVSCKLA